MSDNGIYHVSSLHPSRSYDFICQANDPLCSEPSGLLQGALNQPPAQPSEPNHCDAGVMLHGTTEAPA